MKLIYFSSKIFSSVLLMIAFITVRESENQISANNFLYNYSFIGLFTGMFFSPLITLTVRKIASPLIHNVILFFKKYKYYLLLLYPLGLVSINFILLLAAFSAGYVILVESLNIRNENYLLASIYIFVYGIIRCSFFLFIDINNGFLYYLILLSLPVVLFKLKTLKAPTIKSESFFNKFGLIVLFIGSFSSLRTFIDKWFMFNEISEDLLVNYYFYLQLAAGVCTPLYGMISTFFTNKIYADFDSNQPFNKYFKIESIFFVLIIFGSLFGLLGFRFLNYMGMSIEFDISLFYLSILSLFFFYLSQLRSISNLANVDSLRFMYYNVLSVVLPGLGLILFNVNSIEKVLVIYLSSNFLLYTYAIFTSKKQSEVFSGQ
jgi:hypothetical protein